MTKSQSQQFMRARAALKLAQRERALLKRALDYVPIATGGYRRGIYSRKQREALLGVSLGIRAAQAALRALQQTVGRSVQGRWKDAALSLPPIEGSDMTRTHFENLENENRRLRRIIAVTIRLGRPVS